MVITVIKTLLFFVIPGALVGILLTSVGIHVVKFAIAEITGISMVIEYGIVTALVGVLVALVLPFSSMVKPIIQETSIELRDALDPFRAKVQTL